MPILSYSFNDDFFAKKTVDAYRNFKYCQAVDIMNSIASFINIPSYQYPPIDFNPYHKDIPNLDVKSLSKYFDIKGAIQDIENILDEHHIKLSSTENIAKEFRNVNPNNAKRDILLALLLDAVYEILSTNKDKHLLGTTPKDAAGKLMEATIQKRNRKFFLYAFKGNTDIKSFTKLSSPSNNSSTYYHAYAADVIKEKIESIGNPHDSPEKVRNDILADKEYLNEIALFKMGKYKNLDLISGNYVDYFTHTLAPSEEIKRIYKRNTANALATARNKNLPTNNEVLPLYEQMVFLYYGMCFISYSKNLKDKTTNPDVYPCLYKWNTAIPDGYLNNSYVNEVKNIPGYFNPTSDILNDDIFNPKSLATTSRLTSNEKTILKKFLAQCYLLHVKKLKKLLKNISSAIKTQKTEKLYGAIDSLIKEIFYLEHVLRHSNLFEKYLLEVIPQRTLYHLTVQLHVSIRENIQQQNGKNVLQEEFNKYSSCIDELKEKYQDISTQKELVELVQSLLADYCKEFCSGKKSSINITTLPSYTMIKGILKEIIYQGLKTEPKKR